MNTGNTQAALHTCNCCHRELPIREFYINKSTGRADSYCKACRVRYNQQKRKENIFPIIAPLNGNMCICGMDFPLALQEKLAGGNVVECEHCRRFVYKA